VKAPSKGHGVGPWMTLSATADIGCGGCHDNGPFIRSPYLNQVKGLNPHSGLDDRLPGSDDPTFNRTQPYAFVGKNFASWKAFKVEIAGNECNYCHRLGVNNISVNTFPCNTDNNNHCGTALDFAERATSADEKSEEDQRDAHKNSPSETSPIWMPPVPKQTSFNQAHANSAKAIHDCALRLRETPLPNSDACRITLFAEAYHETPPKRDLTSLYYLLEPSKGSASIYYLITDGHVP
jgi:hypothetical protein